MTLGDQNQRGQLQNLPDGPAPDDINLVGVILRLNDDGSIPDDNPFFAQGGEMGGAVGTNIQKIYAYGIRNTFGMTFDPTSGALWETERIANPAAVAGVLGETRASLLAALGDPASSTELGVRFDVTPSAVNQHLRALRDAGLLVSTRYGRSVLYLRSELGSALLGGRTPSG